MENKNYGVFFIAFLMFSCISKKDKTLDITIYETSVKGKKLEKVTPIISESDFDAFIEIIPEQKFQKITGFGGAFTESSAYLLNKLSPTNRKKIIEAYFGESGAKYSLTRTHIGSCDFSLSNYSYAEIPEDINLKYFSIKEDKNDIIPMIKDAMKVSKEGFKIIASPWTAPPWMKDNKNWVGGKLLPKYANTWALYFSKYIDAYLKEGIPIWGITVENEPLGNGNNWESMHFTPIEMVNFVKNHLKPILQKTQKKDLKILGYDQNREHLREWVNEMYKNEGVAKYFDGTAIHWYASTYEIFPKELRYTHKKAPQKHLIQTEACVDSEVPKWKDNQWYWSQKATDWGWDWASEKEKYLHLKYAPVHRYADDIIGCLNNWVDGWIDWNMVLDTQGGPNWFKNWCIAPVIVNPKTDEVYFTPIYYVLSHFSRYIRPKSQRIGFKNTDKNLKVTAVQNLNNTIVVVIFNKELTTKKIRLALGEKSASIKIDAQAIQTIVIQP